MLPPLAHHVPKPCATDRHSQEALPLPTVASGGDLRSSPTEGARVPDYSHKHYDGIPDRYRRRRPPEGDDRKLPSMFASVCGIAGFFLVVAVLSGLIDLW